ncbi:MAG: hypothetical protein P1U40_02170 [Coxiellaceae bacterium]|nr:hypothetical protein [Coxiellaceae bacterium]
MKAFRWTLVGLLLFSLLSVAWAVLVYFCYAIVDQFQYLLHFYPISGYFIKWYPYLYPIVVLGALSFHFTCEQRFPRLTVLGLLLCLCIAVFSVFLMHDKLTVRVFKELKPRADDYICSPTSVISLEQGRYFYYDYATRSAYVGRYVSYQELQQAKGDKLLRQCKNKKGQSVPRQLLPKDKPII